MTGVAFSRISASSLLTRLSESPAQESAFDPQIGQGLLREYVSHRIARACGQRSETKLFLEVLFASGCDRRRVTEAQREDYK
jgi:hypothetical protein